MKNLVRIAFLAFVAVSLSACMAPAVKMAPPEQIAAPEPIPDTTGEFMNPYTEDGVLAKWVDKAMNAKMGAQAGSLIGAYAGQKAMENIPFVGGIIGQEVGNKLGREIALKSVGGIDFVKETSDSSFKTVDDLALYMYATHSSHKHYAEALDATMAIYPELKQRYHAAIYSASANVQ
jgi:hypothetical protein